MRALIGFLVGISISLFAHAQNDATKEISAQRTLKIYLSAILGQDKNRHSDLLDPKFKKILIENGKFPSQYSERIIERFHGKERRLLESKFNRGVLISSKQRLNESVYLVKLDNSLKLPFGHLSDYEVVALTTNDQGKNWSVIDNPCAIRGFMSKEYSDSGFDLEDFFANET